MSERILDKDLELNVLSQAAVGKVTIPAGTRICLGKEGNFSAPAAEVRWEADALLCFTDRYAIESLSKPAPKGRMALLLEET